MVGIGDFCRNTYNNFKSIYIYLISKGSSLMVGDSAQRKNIRTFIPMVRIGRSYLDLSYIAVILVVQLLVILLRYAVIRYI